MLDIVLNEIEIVKAALNNNVISKNPSITLKALLKYYYLHKVTDKEMLKEILMCFMQQSYDDFIRSKWETSINRLVENFFKNLKKYDVKIELIDIKNIEVREKELEEIRKLNNITLEKVAFVLLIYAKISNIIMKNASGWINISCPTICKEAKVNLKGTDKYKVFHELYERKYIQQLSSTEKTNIRVDYLDYESETIIEINQFEGVVHYYLNWIGENWRLCEKCKKKWFKAKNNKNKYCRFCAKEMELEKYKKYNKKRKLPPIEKAM